MIHSIADMTHVQLNTWLMPIVDRPLFESRERLIALLAENADRDALEAEFREFFEGYCGLAFSLEDHEESLLLTLNECETYTPLQHRVAVVESERKTSPLGREARRMGGGVVSGDPAPEIKVSTLSDDAFRVLMETLANWELFAAHAQVVKLQNATPSVVETEQLKSVFFEFFVCYLELEQFLEDYDYDPDEGLELRPEVAERLEQSVAEYESGAVKAVPMEEVAKKLGLKW